MTSRILLCECELRDRGSPAPGSEPEYVGLSTCRSGGPACFRVHTFTNGTLHGADMKEPKHNIIIYNLVHHAILLSN